MLEQLIRAHIEEINQLKDSIDFHDLDLKMQEKKITIIMDTIDYFKEKVNCMNRFNNDDGDWPNNFSNRNPMSSRLSNDNFLLVTDSESESSEESVKYQATESDYNFDEIDDAHKNMLDKTMIKALIDRSETRFRTFGNMLECRCCFAATSSRTLTKCALPTAST